MVRPRITCGLAVCAVVAAIAAALLLPGRGAVTETPVAALGITEPNTPPDLGGTVVTGHTVVVGGTTRTFRAIVAAHLPAGRRLPLLIVLAGRGEGGWTAVRTTGFLPLASGGRAVLAYPDGVGRSWNAGGGCCGAAGLRKLPDVAVVGAVATAAERDLPVDPSRVYLAGYSNGGKLAYAAACTDPRRYAGVATYGAVPLAACPAGPPLPFLLTAGARDPVLPFGGAPHSRPPTVAVPAAAAALAARDRCTGAPVRSAAGAATATSWSGCAAGTSVRMLVYPAQGHGWPASLAAQVWAFFSEARPASGATGASRG